MNESTPLLNPGNDAPAMIIHNVQHDATQQMGQCCMGDGVKTNTLCEICSNWICKAHVRRHRSYGEETTGEMGSPLCFLSETSRVRYLVDPVCPNCEKWEERPPGQNKKTLNTTGKIMLCLIALILIVITASVFAN